MCEELTNIKLTRNLSWTEILLSRTNNTVKVSHAGLSFKEVKMPKYNHDQYNEFLGMDFSGFDANGTRVMGVVRQGAVSNMVESDPDLLWAVPETWSLEEAATVPLPFVHAYYCLIIKYSLHRGKRILITGGAGSFGQALITLSLALDCIVFTTVSNEIKKRYLLKIFPQLDEKNIGFSEEDAYYMVQLNTKYQRCHVVINNSGVRFNEVAMQCLGEGGFYMDVNGTDINEKMDFHTRHLDNSTNHSFVDLSSLLSSNQTKEKKLLQKLIAEGIAKGIVRPLIRVVYSAVDVTKALNLLTLRRYVGRVLVNMEEYGKSRNDLRIIDRLILNPDESYVVVCDATEKGIELAHRLINRGARNLVIHSKFNKGYYQMMERSWKKLNVTTKFTSENLGTKTGCEILLNTNVEMGSVTGIFIVNNVSHDNEVNKSYDINNIEMMKNLDDVSRSYFDLRYFVVLAHFPKNYQHAKLVTQCTRICQDRNCSGKPALLLQVETINENDYNNTQSNTILQKNSTILTALETSIRRKYTSVYYNTKTATDNELKNNVHQVENRVAAKGLGCFFKRIEENEIKTPEVFVNMTNKISNSSEIEDIVNPDGALMLMIPGFDGNCSVFEAICEMLKIQAFAVQLDPNLSNNRIEETASDIMKFMKRRFRLKSKFHFFGYSFGVNVALELAYRFEMEGHVGLVYCLDSSPDILRVQLQANIGNLSCIQMQDSVICHMYQLISGREDKELLNTLEDLDWSMKVDVCINRLKKTVHYSHEYMRFLIETTFRRIIQSKNYEPKFILKSKLVLIKSLSSSLPEDYNLTKYSEEPVKIFNIECSHATAPSDCRVANIVNSLLDPETLNEYTKNKTCDTYLYNPYNLE